MNPDDYRKKMERDLASAAKKVASATRFRDASLPAKTRYADLVKLASLEHPEDLAAAQSLVGDEKADTKLRAAAIHKLGASIGDDRALVEQLVKLLGASDVPVPVRSAALQSLRSADFHLTDFRASRAKYIAALRSAVESEDASLRQRSLGVLAREKDGRTQRKLVEGLREPKSALVPPQKALQLLAYDTKGDWYDLLREIVKKPPDEGSRLQALRMLAADASSRELFEKLLRNRKEPVEVRRVALAALHSMKAPSLAAHAASVVGNDDEDDEIRRACLVAASLGPATPELHASAEKMHRGASSAASRKTAKQYLTKTRGPG